MGNLINFFLVVVFLLSHLAYTGYPNFFPDTKRYLGAALLSTPNHISILVIPLIVGPAVWILGAYAFVLLQIVLMSYALSALASYFKVNILAVFLALYLSAANFAVLNVMMDIYTPIGLIILFLILNGQGTALNYCIMSLCYLAHYSNIPLYPIAAGVYYLAFRPCEKKTIFMVISTLLLLIPLIGFTNMYLEGAFRISPKSTYMNIVAPILQKNPKIFYEYILANPESFFSSKRDKYEGFRRQELTSFLHSPEGIFGDISEIEQVNTESRDFYIYCLKYHPMDIGKFYFRKVSEFLQTPDFSHSFIRNKKHLFDILGDYYPSHLDIAKDSLQGRNKFRKVLDFKLYETWYAVCMICLISYLIVFGLLRRGYRSMLLDFAFFCTMIMLLNAFFMGITGVYGRYQVKMLILPSFFTMLLALKAVKKVFELGKKSMEHRAI